MNEHRRRLNAQFLLAVFSCMLLLTWCHVHTYDAGLDCPECHHHVGHAHMSIPHVGIDTCLLCQIVHTPYQPAALLSHAVMFRLVAAKPVRFCCKAVIAPVRSAVSLRAPPAA
ncbi:MAG: hypothetical protein IJ139_09180 [Bacteroidaceae bacterium]|nr:hypothetical protein [Bacteroidaceae bacterium]MBQ9177023.1 hypothetical protein [Bacteroidaceae bacterium]MBR1379783.1 hypothetical protein [Bacteroidaceae bacterium]